jgi:hypothetical protein
VRHFAFDYYPWYGTEPWVHWDNLERSPPYDIAANTLPRLGPYDSRSYAVLEQHARWIRESGVGSIALSWWGPDSFEDRVVPRLMDVMKDHDLKVSFGLEPYRDDRGEHYANDVLYLVREYGEKRAWDAFLVLRNADGSEGPVFKGFRCVLPPETVDCHGVRQAVRDYTADDTWRQQIDMVRRSLRHEFDGLTLLADSLEFARTPASGFDGIAVYDNFVPPEAYAPLADQASRAGLVFSFNINPGYDEIQPRFIDPDGCYAPRPFAPPTDGLDWSLASERERAARRSTERILESGEIAIAVQNDPALSNYQRGFFLVYVNSFNEWHEGHAFEPMKDAALLHPEERRHGYHNPSLGDYRLRALRSVLSELGGPPSPLQEPGGSGTI